MFLRGPSTKMSLTFLTTIMVLEILNNVGKHFCRKFQLSHHFVEKIVANPKYIIQKLRIFLFLGDPSTKTYLTFFTVISESNIHTHLYRLFFRLCKTRFYTYCCRDYCAQLERKFRKMKEVYLTNILIHNNRFHVLHIYYGLRNTKIALDPKFAELFEQNAQRKEAVSDLDASSSNTCWIKFEFSSFSSPIHKK